MRKHLASALFSALTMTAFFPSAAGAADLATYFQRAATAEYSGEQVLTCKTPVGIRDTAARVQQRAGTIYVQAGVAGAPTISAGAGTLAATGPGGAAKSVEFAAAIKAPSSYTISATEQVTYIDRLADRVTLSVGGKNRVRLTFDQQTGALLRSETLNGDGSVYCTTRLTSFVAGTPDVPAGAVPPARKVTREADFSATVFPAKLGSFRRLDVWGWNDVGEMAYYSDGFFAFALYHVDARFSVESITEAREWEGKAGKYWRWFRPGTTTLVWDTKEGGMALHGDLPVDMQQAVLDGLPAPSSPNLISRILSLLGR